MQIDLAGAGAGTWGDPAELQAQVCIIGGGIAGLVLASKLCDAGVDVVLLEAGGASPEAAEQELSSEVRLSGQPHLGTSEGRTRALGGSSVTWGGQLLPMSDGANWPVPVSQLEPYYGEIHRLLGVDDLPYGAQAFLVAQGDPSLNPSAPMSKLVPTMSRFAPFGRRNLARSLGRMLLKHPRARVLLHAQATELELSAEGDRIEAVRVRAPWGKPLGVRAQHTVVAAGTAETCRLLLLSRSRCPAGVGNGHDQVGRNFHDHLTVEVAAFEGAARERAAALFRPWLVGGLRGTAHAFKLQTHTKLGLNPAVAHLTFEEPADSGVGALREALRAWQKDPGAGPWRHLGALPRAGLDMWHLQQEAHQCRRRYVSARAKVALRVNVAQEIPSRSRVFLGDVPDRTGQAQVAVDWHHAAADLRTIRVVAAYLRTRFAQIGLSEQSGMIWRKDILQGSAEGPPHASGADPHPQIPGVEDARHAMGGACMGTDRRSSVVDPQLRVHGIGNLWIASAAVFPDGSPHLPTLTLMALALRLAEHLRADLQR